MNERSDIDRVLHRWFDDGPSTMPDRVVDVVTGRIALEHQRPARRLPWRHRVMNPMLKFGAAIAAVFVIAVVGWTLLPIGPAGIGGPPAAASPTPTSAPTRAPTPTATASASLAAGACEFGIGCAGQLTSGQARSYHFRPHLWFTTSGGWTNSVDEPSVYKLDRSAADGSSILVWSGAAIAEQTPSCEPVARPGSAHDTADDWLAFIGSHPGLDASTPTAVELDRSRGWAVELTVAADWTTTCPTHADKPEVMLLVNQVGGEYGIFTGQRLHLFVVDFVPIGCANGDTSCTSTVVIEVYGSGGADEFATAVAAARTVIDTFSFGCGPSYGRGPCGT
jgi:hypothetical protein